MTESEEFSNVVVVETIKKTKKRNTSYVPTDPSTFKSFFSDNIKTIKPANLPPVRLSNKMKNLDLSNYTTDEIDIFKQKAKDFDTTSGVGILNFGLPVQQKMSSSSAAFLENVRSFDTGEIGGSITELLTNINYIDVDPGSKSLLKRLAMKIPFLKGAVMNVTKMFDKYDTVNGNIEKIVTKLDKSRVIMDSDNVKLEKLKNENINLIYDLDELLIIGNMKSQDLTDELTHMEVNIQDFEDYEISEKRDLVNRLDKRLHDMSIQRLITIQSIPQIALVQNNNFVLAEKIQSSIVTTIPIWRQQIAIAVAIVRQKNNSEISKFVDDTTNRILMKNAEMLKTNSIEIAKQNERAVVDISTIQKVQQDLISTIKDIKRIKDEGVVTRENSTKELKRLEQELSSNVIQIDTKVRGLKELR
jgi:uncharacterized protein YaaN involved in tellurite resistance